MMFYYSEYFIRCPTCGFFISCYAPYFENMVNSGTPKEVALNELGINNVCCRFNLLNPTNVPFHMSNREVIEGFKSDLLVIPGEPSTASLSNPTFDSCLTVGTVMPVAPTAAQLLSTAVVSKAPTLPTAAPIGSLRSTTQISTTSTGVIAPQIISQPHLPLLQPDRVVEVIPVEPPKIALVEYKEPAVGGLPTINSTPTESTQQMYVGAKRTVLILKRRTYLCV